MRITLPFTHGVAAPTGIKHWSSGIASFDAALGGGMAYGRVHEIYAAEGEDDAASAGLAMAWASAMGELGQASFWLRLRRDIRHGGVIQANGWAELGGRPEEVIFGNFPDATALLRAAASVLQCAAVGAVIVEGRGRMRELDLTASRRLSLAAEKSGVPLFLLRLEAVPTPSAAQTRWQVAAAASQSLPGNAPGKPTFDIELLRQKSGPSGMRWRLEWDRDQRQFHEIQSGKIKSAGITPGTTALSGAVVSVSARRPAADSRGESRHRIGRRAA